MRCFIFLIANLCCVGLQAQADNFKTLLSEAERLTFEDPRQASNIAQHALSVTQGAQQRALADLALYAAHYAESDVAPAVSEIFLAKQYAEQSDDLNLQCRVAAYGLPLLYQLGLDLVAQKYVAELKIRGADQTVPWFVRCTQLASKFGASGFGDVGFSSEKTGDHLWQSIVAIAATDLYHRQRRVQAYTTFNLSKGSTIQKFLNNLAASDSLFVIPEYHNAIKQYKLALADAKILNNKVLEEIITAKLAQAYLGLKDNAAFQEYQSAYASLADQNETEEQAGVSAIYQAISRNQLSRQEEVKSRYQWLCIVGVILILGTAGYYLIQKIKYRNRLSQYREFLDYLTKKAPVAPKKIFTKTAAISKDTENLILKRLGQFENSSLFLRKDMSLAQLAAQIDTNTKYLSEVINDYKGKNFNAYINELRINYIVGKLEKHRRYRQYRISYLAQECGFSSHSSFGSVFKQVTGISPTVFLEILESRHDEAVIPDTADENVS